MSSNNRIIQFDVLRIIAALAVVLLHTSGQKYIDSYPSIEWDVRNICDSLVRWAVPIFVMISGALFLDSKKTIKTKKLYSRNITRIILIFAFWSVIYAVYAGDDKGILFMFGRMIKGPFHFWFLKMIIGLYITVPIVRAITANKKLEQYFLCLSFLTAFLIPMIFPLMGYISDEAKEYAVNYYNEFGIKIASGYVGYFVLGHYLTSNVIKKTTKRVIYFLGILSVVAVCILTDFVSNRAGTPDMVFYDNVNVFTLFEATALFIFIKDIKIAPKYQPFIINSSKLSLGIYIVHPLVMVILLDLWKFDSAFLNPVYFIPIYALIIFLISYCVSYVLTRIPIIKKFML